MSYDVVLTTTIIWLPFALMWWNKQRFKPLAKTKNDAPYKKEMDGLDFTDELRTQIWLRDKKRCRSCGRKTYLRKAKPSRGIFKKHRLANAHHCAPDDFGFDACLENGVNLCRECNLKFSNAITAWSIDYMRYLWKQGKPYKLYLTTEEKKNLWKPNWRRV